MVNLLFVVLLAKTAHTSVAVMASTITQLFGQSASSTLKPSDSDNIILPPESINPRRNPEAFINPDEFKLQGKQYIRCSTLARNSKHTKKRTSVIWLYGEDIQLKHDGKKFWYCYFCEKQRNQQELPIVGKGNTTALDHLQTKHNIDRATGEYKPSKKASEDPNQLSISWPPALPKMLTNQ